MKHALVAGGLLAAMLVAFLLWPRTTGQENPAAEETAAPGNRPLRGPASNSASTSASSALREEDVQPGAPGSTPPLSPPASSKDGFVEVRVVAQGKPIAGAHIRLYLRGSADRSTRPVDWRLAGIAETSPDGSARIAARPGRYLAAARSGAFSPARVEFQRRAGESITRIFMELKPGIVISGRTVHKASPLEPVPLALVTLAFDAGARGSRPDVPTEEQARATADAQGRFRVEGLAAGRYLVTAQAAGYAKASAIVDARANREIALELAAAAFIEGRVTTAGGQPAGGAEVLASGGDETAAATAGDSGTFSLEVAPRTWTLTAHRGDQAGKAERPVTVAAGGTARGVTIQLGEASGIVGSVVAAADQRPVAGAQISISPYGSSGESGRAVSDAGGAFEVKSLAPGSYDVVVNADGYTEVIRRGVTVDAGQRFPLRIELRGTGALEGLVRDASGRGIPNALVHANQRFARTDAPQDEARTDSAGAYRLEGVTPGRGSFVAMRDGSALGTTAIADVPEGGTGRLDFQIRDEGVLTGHLRRKDGSPPPPDATVRAMPSDNRSFRPDDGTPLSVDGAGLYVASLPAGSYLLWAQNARGGGQSRNRVLAVVEAGKTSTQDLLLADVADDAQAFSGTVLEPDGGGSAGAMVRAAGSSGDRSLGFSVVADESGHFQLDRSRADLPQTFLVLAFNGGRAGQTAVAPGVPDVTIQLRPGATVRGHLVDGPVDGFVVEARPIGGAGGFGGAAQSLQFSGDRFVMSDLPAQSVRVVVSTRDGRSASQDVSLAPKMVRDIEVALQPMATVSGRLVDSASQSIIQDAFVFVDTLRSSQSDGTRTDATGRFRLRVPAGDHALHCFLPRYKGLNRAFTVAAGQQLELNDVALERQTVQPGTIGATLRGDTAQVATVASVVPDGPAEKGGLLVGDQVTTVDGAQIKGVTDAVRRLRGAPGTPVQLIVQRGALARALTITRATP